MCCHNSCGQQCRLCGCSRWRWRKLVLWWWRWWRCSRYYANTTTNPQTCAPAAPLNNPFQVGTAVTVATQGYPITVGAGGTGSPAFPAGTSNTAGASSIFSTITSAGGGKGGNYTRPTASQPGTSGGSGGGGGSWPGPGPNPGGDGNTPPTSPSQGNPGGQGLHISCDVGGGGGGALTPGANAAQPYLGGTCWCRCWY